MFVPEWGSGKIKISRFQVVSGWIEVYHVFKASLCQPELLVSALLILDVKFPERNSQRIVLWDLFNGVYVDVFGIFSLSDSPECFCESFIRPCIQRVLSDSGLEIINCSLVILYLGAIKVPQARKGPRIRQIT